MPLRWWIATVSPLLFLAAALVLALVAGTLPSWDDVDRFSGLPTLGLASVTALVILGALGEETGWRGFALPLLQRRYSALAAALLVTPIWAALAPAFLPHHLDLPRLRASRIHRLRVRAWLRLHRPHLALQPDGRKHPGLRYLARSLQHGDRERRRKRNARRL